MLTKKQNAMLTQTGRGTPMGNVMRRYWQPAALSEELPAGGAPLRITLLGEELVLFRGRDQRPGLLGLRCPHRGTDLSYGRIEPEGLRCIYHGWLDRKSTRLNSSHPPSLHAALPICAATGSRPRSPKSCQPAARRCASRCWARSWCCFAAATSGRGCSDCAAHTAGPISATDGSSPKGCGASTTAG